MYCGTMLAGTASFGQGFGGWVDGLLLLSGAVTAVPLLLFGLAVRRLRLATLGFLQYLTPSIQWVSATTWESPVSRFADKCNHLGVTR